MKTLQDYEEKRYELKALAVFDGVERAVPNPEQVVLLLHGLHERGLRIYRKLVRFLPDNALILAPNAPFPLPREKVGRTEYGYCWYFYDRQTKSYYLNQTLAVSWLTEFLKSKNVSDLPLTIIGFSQGGYLAPLLGHALPQTKLVIGLGCEFRDNLVSPEIKFPLIGLHGENDKVVSVDHSRADAEKLQAKNLPVTWETIPDTAHEISERMGEKVKSILESYGKNSL
ncbi:MAG: dienelactone hydrolase family protein [Bdellovibrionota bacterium]